ncbi:hypothetical protein BN135_3393 [Cronobacter muytjensii 530]
MIVHHRCSTVISQTAALITVAPALSLNHYSGEKKPQVSACGFYWRNALRDYGRSDG